MGKEVLFGAVHVKMCHAEFLPAEGSLLHWHDWVELTDAPQVGVFPKWLLDNARAGQESKPWTNSA